MEMRSKIQQALDRAKAIENPYQEFSVLSPLKGETELRLRPRGLTAEKAKIIAPWIRRRLYGQTVLDIGSNLGFWSLLAGLRGATVTGVERRTDIREAADRLRSAIDNEYHAAREVFFVESLQSIGLHPTTPDLLRPVASRRFHSILALSVFHHLWREWRHPKAWIEFLFGLLEPAGVLILELPTEDDPIAAKMDFPYRRVVQAGREVFGPPEEVATTISPTRVAYRFRRSYHS